MPAADTMPLVRILTAVEIACYSIVMDALKRDHGADLQENGWTEELILDGRYSEGWVCVGDVPPVLGMLVAGCQIVKVRQDLVGFRWPDGKRFAKIKGGCLLSGEPMNNYLRGEVDLP